MKTIITAVLAALLASAGLTGTAQAHDWDSGPLGPAPDGWVDYDEARYITVAVAGAIGYHGGVERANLRRLAPWGDGTQDVEVGVRFRDGSLGMSWVSVESGFWFVSFRHPWP